MTRILAILGSGETAPTMVKTHRAIFDSLKGAQPPAVLLDTPYGFQANASDISARAVDYFATSLGRRVDVAELRDVSRDDPLRRQEAIARIGAAKWVLTIVGAVSPEPRIARIRVTSRHQGLRAAHSSRPRRWR